MGDDNRPAYLQILTGIDEVRKMLNKEDTKKSAIERPKDKGHANRAEAEKNDKEAVVKKIFAYDDSED